MASPNELPKIPSFKTTGKKDEQKAGAGPLSSLGKATRPTTEGKTGGLRFPGFGTKGKMPNLRVRGLPGGTSVIDRLKNLRKKDLMFIGAGLSVLCMAPVAEHLMMSPEDKGPMTEGFGTNDPSMFPEGTAPLDPGTGGFSPGGLVGQGTDVITPLNVRDPSALVMGPGATKKAPAAPPPAASAPPPPTKEVASGGWKDALAQSAKAGAKKASQRAKLPKPNVKMSGALRGLSALGGSSRGGSVSFKLPALQSSGSLGKAAHNASPQAQAGPGFRGAASRSRNSAPGGAEGLKGSGSRQADILNQGGGAANALDTAARETIPGGGGAAAGGGSPHKGEDFKAPGHKKPDDSKSLGESLEFLRRKTEMQNALKLKWKKKEWNEFGRGKMIEETILKSALENIVGKGIFEPIGKAIGGAMGAASAGGAGATKYWYCPEHGSFDQSKATKISDTIISVQNGDQAVQLTCSKPWVAVGGEGEAGAKPPERDTPPSEGEHTGSRQSAAEDLGGQGKDLYQQHCKSKDAEGKDVEPAEPWSDGFCESVGEISKAANETFGSIESQTNEANQALVMAKDKLKQAMDLIQPGPEAESKLGELAAVSSAFVSLGAVDGVTLGGQEFKLPKEGKDATVPTKAKFANEKLSGDKVDKAAYEAAKKALNEEAKAIHTAMTDETKNPIKIAKENRTKVEALLVEAENLIKQADGQLAGAGKDRETASGVMTKHSGAYTEGNTSEYQARAGLATKLKEPLEGYGTDIKNLGDQKAYAAGTLVKLKKAQGDTGNSYDDVKGKLAPEALKVAGIEFKEAKTDAEAQAAAAEITPKLTEAYKGLTTVSAQSKTLVDTAIESSKAAAEHIKKYPENKYKPYGQKSNENPTVQSDRRSVSPTQPEPRPEDSGGGLFGG